MKQSIFLAVLSVLLTNGCKEKDSERIAGDSYTNTKTSFVEKTDSWGLTEVNATGTRISAVDYDGDGWTDLFIRENTVAQTSGTIFLDVDRDGYVDLWLGQASAAQDRLSLNTGDGTSPFRGLMEIEYALTENRVYFHWKSTIRNCTRRRA